MAWPCLATMKLRPTPGCTTATVARRSVHPLGLTRIHVVFYTLCDLSRWSPARTFRRRDGVDDGSSEPCQLSASSFDGMLRIAGVRITSTSSRFRSRRLVAAVPPSPPRASKAEPDGASAGAAAGAIVRLGGGGEIPSMDMTCFDAAFARAAAFIALLPEPPPALPLPLPPLAIPALWLLSLALAGESFAADWRSFRRVATASTGSSASSARSGDAVSTDEPAASAASATAASDTRATVASASPRSGEAGSLSSKSGIVDEHL